jgi:hypothetical protein
MQKPRFTRLTNAFSKKLTNHIAMFSRRKHQTIKTTPAVAAGVASEPWTLAKLLEESARIAI